MKEAQSHRGSDKTRTVVVTDPAAARALLDPSTVRHLAPFLGSELSVSEAAEITGEKPNTVLSRVRRFVALGLLEVSREVPRAGRPIKLYTAVADVFFVPFEASEAESLESALAERERYVEDLLRHNVVRGRLEALGNWGTRVYRDERGRLQVQTAVTPDTNVTMLDPGAPAVLSAWRDAVMLDYEDAKELQRELYELLLRYLRYDGSQRYVVHVGMAPVLR
ncbi:MAG TPA: hypothetical protein VF164_03415 [Trueperaceae bacterium]